MTKAKITLTTQELKQFHLKNKGQALKAAKDVQLHLKKLQQPWNPYPCLDKWADKTSNDLTKCIINFLSMLGYQAERIRSEGRAIDNTKIYTDIVGRRKTVGSVKYIKSTSTNGTADISATIEGFSVKIEVKIGKDKQSDDQKKYQASVEQAGGIYYIAKDFQSFYEWLIKLIHKLKEFRNGIRLTS